MIMMRTADLMILRLTTVHENEMIPLLDKEGSGVVESVSTTLAPPPAEQANISHIV
jgi:hypothetical protein